MRREGKVFGDRQVRGGSAKRILENAADEPRAAMLRPARHVLALDVDAAGVDQECPGNRIEQRGFPEPFVPITITNEPSWMVRSTPCKDLTSLGVPALNVFKILFVSSTCGGPHSRDAEFRQQVWQNQREEDKRSGDQLQVVWVEAPAQRDGDEQTK